MSFWICVDEDIAYEYGNKHNNSRKEAVKRTFNIVHGLAPMNENVFVYVIEDMIRSMFYGIQDYVCVGYEPIREDKVSAIQVSRPQINGGYNVEIVFDSETEKGFTTYCQKDVSLEKTLLWFYKVLVEYDCPDLSGWMNITDCISVYAD